MKLLINQSQLRWRWTVLEKTVLEKRNRELNAVMDEIYTHMFSDDATPEADIEGDSKKLKFMNGNLLGLNTGKKVLLQLNKI